MHEISRNILTVDAGKQISFSHDIKKIILFDDLYIVLLKIPTGALLNENIFAVTSDGIIKWQIEKIILNDVDSPYMNIKKSSDGLDAYNWSGVRSRINLDTGMVVSKRITK